MLLEQSEFDEPGPYDAHQFSPPRNPDMLTEFARKVGLPKEWGFVDVFGADVELLGMGWVAYMPPRSDVNRG